MSASVDTHLLGEIRGDLHEMRQLVSHLDFKVQEIGSVFSGAGLSEMVASLKPLLGLLVLQGVANVVLLLLLVFK